MTSLLTEIRDLLDSIDAGISSVDEGISAMPSSTGDALGRALNTTARRAGAAGAHYTG